MWLLIHLFSILSGPRPEIQPAIYPSHKSNRSRNRKQQILQQKEWQSNSFHPTGKVQTAWAGMSNPVFPMQCLAQVLNASYAPQLWMRGYFWTLWPSLGWTICSEIKQTGKETKKWWTSGWQLGWWLRPPWFQWSVWQCRKWRWRRRRRRQVCQELLPSPISLSDRWKSLALFCVGLRIYPRHLL